MTQGAASGEISPKARCAVPRGWRVMMHDRQVVLIARRHRQYSPFDYCNRTTRAGWRVLIKLGSSSGFDPSLLRLAGRYVAYGIVMPPPSSSSIELWDTRTGQHNALPFGGGTVTLPSVPALLLSPSGVAAAVVVTQYYTGEPKYPGPPFATVVALGIHIEGQNVDSAGPPSEIAGLQLYDCATACAANSVIMAWTHAGAQRYAEITS